MSRNLRDVIVTCPPMLLQFDRFVDLAAEKASACTGRKPRKSSPRTS
jgi:hypothetical protein